MKKRIRRKILESIAIVSILLSSLMPLLGVSAYAQESTPSASAQALQGDPLQIQPGDLSVSPTPTPEPTPAPTPIWTESDGGYTTQTLNLGTTYHFPQNEKVSLTFTKLPENSGTVTIKEHEVPLTVENAGSKDYEITSAMPNGSFSFDLTLPTNDPNKKVLTSDDGQNYDEVSNETQVIQDVVTIKGINHLTHFIVGDVTDDPNHPIINEFMPDPDKVSDANGEWIELKNPTSNAINLNGWKIEDASNAHTISADVIILPGNFVVLCREDNASSNGGVACDYEWLSSVSLNNTGSETINLRNPSGTVVDTVNYSVSNVDKGKSVIISENALRTLSIESTSSYGLGDFGTPANNSVAGDTILVAPGTYSENLSIEKGVTLQGAGIGQTTIANNDCGDDQLLIVESNNVVLRGITFDGNGCAKPVIKVDSGQNILIEQNEIKNDSIGILVDSALNNEAHLNRITVNGVGIENDDSNFFDAGMNFWGSETGPASGQIIGNVLYRPFYTDGGLTTLSKFSASGDNFDPATLFSNGIFSLPDGVTDQTNTTSVTINEETTFTVDTSGGTSSVLLSSGTIITNVIDGATINATLLSTKDVSISDLSGFTSNTIVEGALQWGIPNFGIEFSQPITLSIFVGTSFNEQTLSVVRSTTGTGGWTSVGIVAPGTCVVSGGVCTFQATMASFFATNRTVSTSTASSSGGGVGDGKSTQPPVCNDTKPGSAPKLLSITTGVNFVTLTWEEAKDPVSYYLVAYGTSPGSLQFGNQNIGGKGTTTYTVLGLSGNEMYYFKVRAGNGCAPGDYSNELSATPTGFAFAEPALGFQAGVLGAEKAVEGEEREEAQEVSPVIEPTKPVTQQSQPLGGLFAALGSVFTALLSLFGRLFGR